MNHTPAILVVLTISVQLSIACYAIRLNRIFGMARVGWSLFSAFLLMALIHGIRAMTDDQGASIFTIKIEVIYTLASLLLLIGMFHLGTLLKQRVWLEQQEHWLRLELEAELQQKTSHLTLAIKDLQTEIDERKRAEQQIREQARLLDLAHDAIIVHDLEQRVLFWNNGAANIYGWTNQEALGRKLNELLVIESSVFEDAQKAVQQTGCWTGEMSVRAKEEKTILIEADWTLVSDEHGAPKSVLVISSDITERRRLEVQTLRAQRLQSIGTLAGGIAHDLNNVLAPMILSVHLLNKTVADAKGRHYLEILEKSATRAADLVKKILIFGRGIQGNRTVLQLRQIVDDIKHIVRETFPKSLEFDTGCGSGLWTVKGDATLIQQVLLNLCVNARDAMPNGGRLSLRMDNVTLDGNCMHRNIDAKPGNYVVIKVTDNGTGIKKEIQDKLFEPFFTTKEVGKGTGLGLSTSLGIVRSHGGFITCYSEPGNGSTFNVYLPAVPGPDAVEGAPRTNTPVLRGQNELVLVVDDEQAIRVCVQQTLEDSGYRVLTAANGAEALSLYSSWQKEIAIVLIDMTMPVMDGPTAIAALKSLNPRIRIIGASGLNATGNHYETVKESIVDFIPKPYLPGILVQAMHHALQFDTSKAGPNHEKPSPELLKNN